MRVCTIRLFVVFLFVGLVWATAATAQDRFPYSVASGDPTPDSVVLWTKVNEPEVPDALHLEVATDADFSDVVVSRDLVADEAYDYVVKVRVDGLEPYTTYYYRFIYGTGGAMDYSTTGRTRTAPDPSSEQPMRFAVVYCQDYVGRYYNSYQKLLRDHDEDIDFVVHLGDYVYETTGSLEFQDPDSDRLMVFDDVDGAINLGDEDSPNYAAASLANYRTLYRTYRTDPMLQEVHERWPMIVIWDDHEFSDDAWGATATYFDGMKDEYDPDRRRDAEQAFFEWVPIDVGLGDDGTLDIDSSMLYPNATIYRDFHFGSLLHLVMTDYRSFRPDHIVAEDAFPGTIVLDQETLVSMMSQPVFDAVKANFDPYVDLDDLGFKIFSQTLTLIAAGAYMAENPDLDLSAAVDLAEESLEGNISVTMINTMFEAAGLPAPYSAADMERLPRGLSYLLMGKGSMYGSSGSRYMLVKDSYELFAGAQMLATAGAAQDALGGQQMAWLQGVVATSPATWTVIGSSVMMTPLIVDLSNEFIEPMLPPGIPDELKTPLLLNADHWDGFPHMKAEMLGLFGLAPNPIIISGDIHSTFVTDHGGVYEFTGPAVSSATWGTMVARFAASHPILGQMPGLDQILAFLGLIHQLSASDDTVSPSDILYANTQSHGYLLVDANADAFTATLMQLDESETFTDYSEDPDALDELFHESAWQVQDGVLSPVVP